MKRTPVVLAVMASLLLPVHRAQAAGGLPPPPVRVAQSQVGLAGPYTAGGYWCAKFVSWVMEHAHVDNGYWQSSDSPGNIQGFMQRQGWLGPTPMVGGTVFIDLTGRGNPYPSHMGIVEWVSGNTFGTIEGNADNSGVVVRRTRAVGDGFVLNFGYKPYDYDDLISAAYDEAGIGVDANGVLWHENDAAVHGVAQDLAGILGGAGWQTYKLTSDKNAKYDWLLQLAYVYQLGRVGPVADRQWHIQNATSYGVYTDLQGIAAAWIGPTALR